MTPEQWKLIRAGDVVIDTHAQNRPRKIHSISIVRGKPSQRGRVRYALSVDNLKSVFAMTTIFVSDITGPLRFELPAKGTP